jgi:3-hydroxyisobutyrate dehydrogenase-like beta-hydroxyacid dehydrogenase
MRIALLGYGEVGQAMAEDLRALGHTELAAWDILFDGPESAALRAARSNVQISHNCSAALNGAGLVISAVTAGQCVAAAREAAGSIGHGAYFLDVNSVAPRSKHDAAKAIDAAGGHYVEASIMSPIGPKRIASPILLGGPYAQEFAGIARKLGFVGASFYSATLGKAAAAKMCRSVLVKGLESLLTESLLAARRHGVEHEVLDSVKDLLPGTDWKKLSRYMISRSLLHGRRRAEEMQEAASTVQDSGIEPCLSRAIAHRQNATAATGVDPDTPSLEAMLDAMLHDTGEPRC